MTTEQAPLWFQNYVKQHDDFVKQYKRDTARNFKEHAALEEKIDTLPTQAHLEGVRVELMSRIEGSPSPGL